MVVDDFSKVIIITLVIWVITIVLAIVITSMVHDYTCKKCKHYHDDFDDPIKDTEQCAMAMWHCDSCGFNANIPESQCDKVKVCDSCGEMMRRVD